MKKISQVVLMTMVMINFPAHAGFYGSLGVGSTTDIELEDNTGTKFSVDSDVAYSVAVGYEVPLLPLRVEAESISMRGADGDFAGDSYSMNALMLNAYAGLPIPIVSPYIGAGVGEGIATLDNSGSSGYTSAYQVMAGLDVSLPLLPFSVGVEYRYFNSDAKETFADSSIQSVLVKARLQF